MSITLLFADGVNPMIEITKKIFGFPITVTATPAGTDWNVIILGGCAPHVGSISLAEFNGSEVSLRTLLRETHKDQIVGEKFAKAIAEQAKCTVCVSCGIHYDNASQHQLQQIVATTDELLVELCKQV